jgi:hypothetical protein
MVNTIGAAARQLGLVPEADVITGIPISATGKNICHDRESTYYKTKGIKNKQYYEEHFEPLHAQHARAADMLICSSYTVRGFQA